MSNTGSENHIRYHRLVQVVNKALEESIKALSDENLQACYPSLSSTRSGKESISAVKEQLKESWLENSKKEFDAVFEERDIESKLNELDDLIIEAQDRQKNDGAKEIPIDQLTPVNVVNSHLVPVKEANLKNLQKQLEELKNSNKSLLGELNQLSNEATVIQNEVGDKFKGLNKFDELSKESDIQNKLQNLIQAVSTEEKEQII